MERRNPAAAPKDKWETLSVGNTVKTYRRSGVLVGIVYKTVEGLELSGSPQGTSSFLMTLDLCWPTTHPTAAVSLWLGSLRFLPQALASLPSQAWWISVEITPVCSVCFH